MRSPMLETISELEELRAEVKRLAIENAALKERLKDAPRPTTRINYNGGSKFDLQLEPALIRERRLGEIFEYRLIEKIELKTEQWLWEKTGNICIEYQRDGITPSGIAATEADYWVHDLKRDGVTLVYLMFPMDRLKELARAHHRLGHFRIDSGDGGRQAVILIPLDDILR